MLHRAWVLSGLFLCAAAAPQTAADLVGHWPMDAVAANATPSAVGGNPLTLYNGATAGPAPAGFGAGITLDGTDDHLRTPDAAALNFDAGSFTVLLWARPHGTSNRRLVNKWNGGAQQGWILDIHTAQGGGAGVGNLRFRLDSNATANNDLVDNLDVVVAAALGSNAWYHLAGVVDRAASEVRLYVGGTQVGTSTAIPATLGSVSNTFELGVGTIPSAAGAYFDGDLDDLRLYDRALTQAEIQTLMNGIAGPGQPTATPGPLSITVDWPVVTGATGYTVYVSANGTGGPFSQAGTSTGTSFTHTNLDPTVTYTYYVVAVTTLGESEDSPTVSAVPNYPPPRTNDHSEGLFEDRCACGSSIPGLPWLPALLAVLVLCASRR